MTEETRTTKAPESPQPSSGRVLRALADLPPGALLDERGMADALGVCPRTVRRMVDRFEIPPGVQVAGKTQWLAGRVLGWIERRAERDEAKAHAEEERISRAGA